jgi:hypothetical protein
MKWQLKAGQNVYYYDPDDTQLILFNCILRNQQATAIKIHQGKNKTVCAWVDCDFVEVLPATSEIHDLEIIQYNPKVVPYWRDSNGLNIDNSKFAELRSFGKNLFIFKRKNHACSFKKERRSCCYH